MTNDSKPNPDDYFRRYVGKLAKEQNHLLFLRRGNNSKPDPDDYEPEPAFTRSNSMMGIIARFVGTFAVVILIAGTAGYVWVRWL